MRPAIRFTHRYGKIGSLERDLKEEGLCVPHSVETYDVLRAFVHGERGAMAAIKGSHDDRVMALSLANLGRGKM